MQLILTCAKKLTGNQLSVPHADMKIYERHAETDTDIHITLTHAHRHAGDDKIWWRHLPA